MNAKRALELMEIELRCIYRNVEGCNRDCSSCDLVQLDEDLIAAYLLVIDLLEKEIKNEH